MSREAMKLALEALEISPMSRKNKDAIDTLREALANEALDKMAENARELGLDYEPVWGSGPTNKDYEDAMRQKRLHQLTSPPAQRTWVGLTDEDLRKLADKHLFYQPEGYEVSGVFAFARAIEAKLRSKNENRN